MEFSHLFILQPRSLPWGLGPPAWTPDLTLNFWSGLWLGPSSLDLTRPLVSAETLGFSVEADTPSSVGNPRRCHFFLNASSPRPNYQLQSGIQNPYEIYPQDLLLWQATQSNLTTTLLVVSMASKLLTSKSQALLHPSGRHCHHSLQVVAPPVAFNNSARNILCTTTTCNSF